jgi:hypothetical protein
MSLPTADEWERYRAIAAKIEMSSEQRDEVICIIHSIMRHFTDMAFGIDDAQIALAQREGTRSVEEPDRDTVFLLSAHEPYGDLDDGGARNETSNDGLNDGTNHSAKGSHLLPR